MKILISGSNGIIGQQLLNQLLHNYPEAFFFVINRKNNSSKPIDRVRYIEEDLLKIDRSQIDTIITSIRPNLFFHLAWDTSHDNYLDTLKNLEWEKTSIMLINSFYNSGGRRFVGLGSSIEYDWTRENPFKECSSPVTGNRWLYGQSKLNVFKHLSSLNDISYLWGRIFFVFGPEQSKTRLVPLIINNALNGGTPLTINTLLKRDYISTFEIAAQIIMMQKTNYSGAVNICSGRAITIQDIIDCIEDYTKSTVALSSIKYHDNFEIGNIGGSLELLKKYYPDYTYSFEKFQQDLRNTIDKIYESKNDAHKI